MRSIRHYLALGDSYTIGEAVPSEESFPHQLAAMLRAEGHPLDEPRVIAKTGWTTDELTAAIDKYEEHAPLSFDHELVTLLIGVNNQYRGRSSEEFKEEFRSLLLRSILYAYGDPNRVFVLSIPDWGVTPYAEGRNRSDIAAEIDRFNEVKKKITQECGATFIYITDLTREAGEHPELITTDGLHPSGKDYQRWASRVWTELKVI